MRFQTRDGPGLSIRRKLFVAAESVHAIGISVLMYKLTKENTCAGLGIYGIPKYAQLQSSMINCVHVEAVSILPQLRVMQNAKIIEPFTAHYVFVLGVARFLSCAHWILQPPMVLLSEIIRAFNLADFCYYYVKSLVGGQLVLRLPSGVV